MPTYKPRHFAQALNSVLTQTYPALELLICEDNANGAIEAVLASNSLPATSQHWLLRYINFRHGVLELGWRHTTLTNCR
ncbi:hypothetical protein FHR53_003735 [Xanthomonas arboricola]|uniref:hypothetical protein n=1 Tax=Xanthomonas cannabis TaxID=1885674 RepID=UPI0015CCF1FF|nr:hypothetical protein [Xanthomonas cannabis]MBB3805118.1 hypothetical protein [Xanthomonas cannabis]